MSRNPFHALLAGRGNSPTPPSKPATPTGFGDDFNPLQPRAATSLSPPADSPLKLTPLRAHYLKRELVTLEFVRELSALDSPGALSVLGPPFLPKRRFVDGVPVAEGGGLPLPVLAGFDDEDEEEDKVDLPFLRFFFNHFLLTFPFLQSCPDTFFSHKLQPFVYSFVSRNISSSDEREETTARKKIAGKFEKQFGLLLSAAIKLTENGGVEEVVRIADEGDSYAAAPASNRKANGPTFVPMSVSASKQGHQKSEDEFSINVVSVRHMVARGRVRNKAHEEFIVRTTRKGKEPVFVARRYGDFGRLAETLRKECLEEDVPTPPSKDRRSTDVAPDSPSLNGQIPTLARERNRLTLRAYLRTILLNDTLASSSAFQSFLLESPIQLTPGEMHDVKLREDMDHMREAEAEKFRKDVEGRVQELEGYLRGFREELVKSDGLSRVFATVRRTERVEDLPVEYKKVLEWGRISLASTIYQVFLGSDTSSSNLSQLKRIHGMMPYFMLRGILKISNPMAMVRAVLDLFLARPFGSTSLLQKMFTSGMADEARELREDAELVKRKIAHPVMCQKVEDFVNAPKEAQDRYRAEAVAENLDIMSVILRSPAEPSLDARSMQAVQRASVAYEEYKHHRDELSDPEDDEGPDNDDAWLFEDLHVLMRVITKARDKEQLVELIFEGSTSEMLKDIVTIFYEPLAKVYKAANIADSLGDLQTFVNDLIKTVDQAEEANLVDPQRTVQIFIDLVARHESRFYHFVHQVHSKGEGLFDNLMSWIERFINFVRDGLPAPVSLDFLLPHAGQPRIDILAEVDAVIEYHRKLKAAHHERMRRRMVKGEATDKDADAAFVSGVMENLHIGSVMGDVADVNAEDSEEEEDEDDEASSSEDDEPEDVGGYRPFGKSSAGAPGVLERIPNKEGKRKGKVPIVPPTLKLIPQLVPLFVEMGSSSAQTSTGSTLRSDGVDGESRKGIVGPSGLSGSVDAEESVVSPAAERAEEDDKIPAAWLESKDKQNWSDAEKEEWVRRLSVASRRAPVMTLDLPYSIA
ncbi:Phox-like domain-containing protein [Pseudohyphozyma bogoriensis]|nr:Phox-like domain-containing protein [Pseudohyphozyma bogoriensis]